MRGPALPGRAPAAAQSIQGAGGHAGGPTRSAAAWGSALAKQFMGAGSWRAALSGASSPLGMSRHALSGSGVSSLAWLAPTCRCPASDRRSRCCEVRSLDACAPLSVRSCSVTPGCCCPADACRRAPDEALPATHAAPGGGGPICSGGGCSADGSRSVDWAGNCSGADTSDRLMRDQEVRDRTQGAWISRHSRVCAGAKGCTGR